MKDFEYKPIDEEGLETLNVLSQANLFNEWMYKTIQPYCSQNNVLEIGSGVGNISEFFIRNKHTIFLSDLRENYKEILLERFSHDKNIIDFQTIDLVAENFEAKYTHLLGKFETVFALNVIEHIKDDNLAILNCKKLLKEKGKLVILVPAYQFLYNRFDEELYHFRRYKKKGMVQLFKNNNIKIVNSFYFNALGILGWYVSGKIFRNKTLPSSQVSFYNKIIPIAKLIDFLLFNKIGLSVVVVGEK